MIEEIQDRLREWVGGVLEGAKVSFEAPSGERKDRGISLYLIEVVPKPAARGVRTQPLQIALRYLVTASSEDATQADGWVAELLFAALGDPEWEAVLEPIPLAVWRSFSGIPRPSFLLQVPLRRERPHKRVPYVRFPLVVRDSPMEVLEGVVLGPETIPLTGAIVELPALQLSTRTDARGRFRFTAVPTEPRSKLVRVRAKGRETTLKTGPTSYENGRLVIRFSELEV